MRKHACLWRVKAEENEQNFLYFLTAVKFSGLCNPPRFHVASWSTIREIAPDSWRLIQHRRWEREFIDRASEISRRIQTAPSLPRFYQKAIDIHIEWFPCETEKAKRVHHKHRTLNCTKMFLLEDCWTHCMDRNTPPAAQTQSSKPFSCVLPCTSQPPRF